VHERARTPTDSRAQGIVAPTELEAGVIAFTCTRAIFTTVQQGYVV
jgi:hypothetical protein